MQRHSHRLARLARLATLSLLRLRYAPAQVCVAKTEANLGEGSKKERQDKKEVMGSKKGCEATESSVFGKEQ
jgi:hypothetical protein